MSVDSALAHHYRQLLGLPPPWNITSLDLDANKERLDITIEWPDGTLVICPTCASACPMKDHRVERTWRHLDTMQFKTFLHCRVPRCSCPEHGVHTIAVPWGESHSRWTLLFETFALAVLEQVPAIAKAARLLKLSWDETLAIKKRAVKRGLMRRTFENTQYLGLDEKSFGRNERFITVLSDIHGERVLEVAPSKSMAAAIATLSVLPDATRAEIDAVVMDMAAAYENACAAMLPNAEIVYDRYHIEQLLTGAVDKVRRAEHKHLMREGITVLKNSRYLWLRRSERWSEEQEAQYRDIARDFGAAKLAQSKLGRAWAIKESFHWFWSYLYPGWAKRYFIRWYFWATHSRIPHIIAVARTFKERLDGLLNYFHHGITNAFAEGINSKIQDLKSAARGFRSFENYRVAILFSCGRLSMQP